MWPLVPVYQQVALWTELWVGRRFPVRVLWGFRQVESVHSGLQAQPVDGFGS